MKKNGRKSEKLRWQCIQERYDSPEDPKNPAKVQDREGPSKTA